MKQYAELFAAESRDYLSAIEHALLDLERRPNAREPIDALFRAVHTLKGMSGVMGYTAVSEVSHAMETLLSRAREAGGSLGDGDTDLLFDAADALGHVVEAAVRGTPSALDVAALVARMEATSPKTQVSTAAEVPIEGTPIGIVLEPDTPLPGARALLIAERLRSVGRVIGTRPHRDGLLDEAFDGRFTVFVESGEEVGTLMDVVRACGSIRDVRVGRAREREGGSAAWEGERVKAPLQKYVRLELRRLDHLMNLVGELVTERGRLQQEALAAGHAALDESVAKASRLIGELQDAVLGSRLVPVWQVFDRFPKVVRDSARAAGKEATLTVEGREIELDRALLDQVADPLVHLLRNAVDHGIELPDARRAAGKPGAGRLTLSARRERDAVIIAVRDDGRGIQRDRLLARARELDLLGTEIDSVSDEELLRLIARPGFSTADRVSTTSGRGVGVDAVMARVRAMGGSVSLQSREGQGTTFELRLPVTLAIIKAVIARVGDEAYALPLTHVTETVQTRGGALRRVMGRPVFILRETVFPLYNLRRLVGLEQARDGAGQQIVLVEVNERRAAVSVDALDGQRDIVVKSFDTARGSTAVTGAALLPDGMAALILDVGGLLQET